MKIENYNSFSLTKKGMSNPVKQIKGRMGRADSVIKFFKEIRPEDLERYISDLQNKLDWVVGNYEFNLESFDWDQLRAELELLPTLPELEKLIFYYTCKTINLPDNYNSKQGEIKLVYFDQIKAMERLSYYLVLSLVDIYGKEEGTEIYKQIVPHLIKEIKLKDKSKTHADSKSKTIIESNKRAVKSWCKSGVGDFAFCIFDEHKIVYRFDSCLTPEALKVFNNPDVAYLASCYIGDVPEWNEGETIHLRRTQTLHHSKFCDELYWNNYVHPDAEQPSLEFTEKIGKCVETSYKFTKRVGKKLEVM